MNYFLNRRVFCGMLASAGLARSHAKSAYPNRSISWIVPYAPAAASDVLTRQLAKAVSSELGQPVVVENIPGGGSIVGASRAARERPDGYKIVTLDVAGLAINPALQEKLPYDPNKSFAPIALAWRIPFVLVTASAGPKSLSELLDRATKNPKAMTFGSAGNGSAIHMAMELLMDRAAIQMMHVPYNGAAPAMTDVLAGRVDVMFISLGAASSHLQAGTLRALGASGAKRFELMPEIKTIQEQGLSGFEASSWQGVLAPAGLPEDILDQLNRAINAALKSEDVVKKFKSVGADPEGSTPEAFAKYIQDESVKWGNLIRNKGIKLDK